jgi:hypothetical protein
MVLNSVMVGAALLCVACGRDEDPADRAARDAMSDPVRGMMAEFEQLLAAPDRFITPQESRLVRELVDRQFEAGGRLKALAAMLPSGEVRQVAGLWLMDAQEQFLSRVGDSPVLMDDADVLQCVVHLAEYGAISLQRQAAVVLVAKDAGLARSFLLRAYGIVFVSMVGDSEWSIGETMPTIAPALAACGVAAPAEITSLGMARAILSESGIDMEGVDSERLFEVAIQFNWHLHTLAVGGRFEELASLTQPERAAGVLLTLYRRELQNPTPTLSAPPSDWLD